MPTGRGLGLAALPAAKPVPEPEDRPGRLVIPTGRGVRLAALPPALAATPQPATQPQPVHHGDIARRLAELLEEREAEERETEASSTKRWRWPWRRNTHPELPADPTPTPAPAPTPAVVPVTPTPAPAPAPTVTVAEQQRQQRRQAAYNNLAHAITVDTVRDVGEVLIEYESGRRSVYPSFGGGIDGGVAHAAIEAIRPSVAPHLVPERHRYGKTRTHEQYLDALARAQGQWRRWWDQSPARAQQTIQQIVATVGPIQWADSEDQRARTTRDEEQRRRQMADNERSRKALTPAKDKHTVRQNDKDKGWDRD